MTLKKCTVRQLDDVFWRVDWEGPAAEARTANCTLSANSPSIAERDGESWFFCGIWSQSLAEALSRFALTIEDPKPETAEERVRRFAKAHYSDVDVAGHWADLRAILAELDRVREREAALDEAAKVLCVGWAGVPLSARAIVQQREELNRVIANLRAQRPVDVEAVLAPVREMINRFTTRFDRERDLRERLAESFEDALHEAEKIGRGQ